VADGTPPWSLYLATLQEATQVAIWRADTPVEQHPTLLAQACAAGVIWDEAHAMRREVVFAPPATASHGDVDPHVRVLTEADSALLEAFEAGSAAYFLSASAAPCVGVVVEGRLVSVAHSSRQTRAACELGINTLADARRQGYAASATALWTALVQARGLTPIYSAFAWNEASLGLALSVGYTRRIESVYGPVPPSER
jgi:RimJ/RimL family protein N-acetyltransferase